MLRRRFDRFVRTLGHSPENADERETAGGCRYQGDCCDGFHGAKSDRERGLAYSAEGHQKRKARMTLVISFLIVLSQNPKLTPVL